MSLNYKNLTIFLSLILCIYFLRSNPLSSIRLLDQQQLIDKFCEGVSESDSYTESQRDQAAGFRNSIGNIRPDDKTLTAFISDDQSSGNFIGDYAIGVLPVLIPWLVFFAIGAVGCLVFLINWCCINCSCCARCACRCCLSPKINAKSNRRTNFFVAASILFMLMTVGAGTAGLIFSTKIPKQANATICWTVRLMEKINEGSADDNWIGMNPAIKNIDSIATNITNTVIGLNVFNDIMASLTNNLNQATNLVSLTYADNKDVTISRINPDETTPYTPDYISNLGPPSSSSTSTGLILAELNIKRSFVSLIQPIVTEYTGIIETQAQAVINGIRTVRSILLQVSDTTEDVSSDVQSNQNTISTVIQIIGGVLLGLFIANVVIGLLALLSITFVCRGVKGFNKGIHASWCILGLLMLIGWIVTTAVFAGTVVVSETCDVGSGITQDPAFFNKTFGYLNTVFDINDSDFNKTRDVLYYCFYGEGDLASELNILKNAEDFNQIFSTIDRFSTLAAFTLYTLPSSATTSALISGLNQISAGTVPDSAQYTLKDLQRLNEFTNSDQNSCTTVNDLWVLNSQSCTASSGTKFTETSSADFNLNSDTCIGYNVWEISGDNIENRYTADQFPEGTCGQVNGQAMYSYVQRYVESLAQNRAETETVVDRLLQDLGNIDDLNNQFKSATQAIPFQINSLNTLVASIYTGLTDANGLINNAQCKWIRNDFEILLDETCTGLGANMFQITIVYLVLSFGTLLGTMMLFCVAKRPVEKTKKTRAISSITKVYLENI